MIKFRIARRQLSPHRMGAVRRQERRSIALDTEVGAEITPPLHHVFGRVVQIGGAGVFHLGSSPAWPGQTEIFSIQIQARLFVDAALGLERLDIKHLHVAHVGFESLGALSGVANGPDGTVDLAQDRLGFGLHPALALNHFKILNQLLGEAKFFSQLVHDHVVGAAFPERVDDLFAPLDGAV